MGERTELEQESRVTIQWKDHGQVLSNGIWNFLKNEYMVDTNVTFGGECLKVHRLILAIFLPTVQQYINDATANRCGDKLEFQELNLDCVAGRAQDICTLVEFAYNGRVSVSKDRIDHLARLAERLEFEGLMTAIGETGMQSSKTSEEASAFIDETTEAVRIKLEPEMMDTDGTQDSDAPLSARIKEEPEDDYETELHCLVWGGKKLGTAAVDEPIESDSSNFTTEQELQQNGKIEEHISSDVRLVVKAEPEIEDDNPPRVHTTIGDTQQAPKCTYLRIGSKRMKGSLVTAATMTSPFPNDQVTGHHVGQLQQTSQSPNRLHFIKPTYTYSKTSPKCSGSRANSNIVRLQPTETFTCGYSSKSRHYVEKHKKEKAYECNLCDFTCQTLCGLDRHKQSHLRLRPFKCEYCNQSYADNWPLQRHLARHYTALYSCHMCGHPCDTREYLQVHLINVHNSKVAVCNSVVCPNSEQVQQRKPPDQP